MYKNIYDICIIGAGASGLVAAIESSRRGLSCVVVDKNKKAGMKLYATGNGRCNLTNDTWEEDTYYENEFVDRVFDYLYRETGMRQRTFILDYFKGLGVNTVNKDGYFYPSSMQASSVVWALLDAARALNIEIKNKTTCISIDALNLSDIIDDVNTIDDSIFDLKTIYRVNTIAKDSETGEETVSEIIARNIIIATGGQSQAKLGAQSSEMAKKLFSSLRVPYEEFQSGLCPVKCYEDLSALAGVRTRARLSVAGHRELGEVQITEDGLSGIVTFNMSYYMKPGSPISINLLPKTSEDEFAEHFNAIQKEFPNKRLDSFINGYINDKLASYMISKFYGTPDIKFTLKDVTETGIRGLYQEITEWKLTVLEKGTFDSSQASIGGILTDVISPSTMQISPDRTLGGGIYAVGEATDVIGKCGGYNLTYAFITGYIAGNSVE